MLPRWNTTNLSDCGFTFLKSTIFSKAHVMSPIFKKLSSVTPSVSTQICKKENPASLFLFLVTSTSQYMHIPSTECQRKGASTFMADLTVFAETALYTAATFTPENDGSVSFASNQWANCIIQTTTIMLYHNLYHLEYPHHTTYMFQIEHHLLKP